MTIAQAPQPAQRSLTGTVSHLGRNTHQVERLFIDRQSGPNAQNLLRKMHERTLTKHNTVPGYKAIRAAGIDPLFDRDQYKKWWSLPANGRATLFQVDGTYVLLVLGSAAARDTALSEADDATENAVVELYKEVLAELKPRTVLAGPFDRLVRAIAYSYPTYVAFKSHVSYLKCDEGTLDFGNPKAEGTWHDWTSDAADSHKRTIGRTADGATSMIRDNQWHMAQAQAPFGLEVDDSNNFHVCPGEVETIAAIIGYLVDDGLSQAETARRLVAAGQLPPRRKGFDGQRLFQGMTMQTSDGAELSRATQVVGRILMLLPDMAMGKYVTSRKQTSSVDAVFEGARRRGRPGGGYEHRFAWDVPDVFSDIDDDVLLEAVRLGAMARVRNDHPASEWLLEVAARAETRGIIEAGEESPGYDEAVRWAGETGALIEVMGSGPEHPRSWAVRRIIAEVTDVDVLSRDHRGGGPGREVRLFSRWPVTVGKDGNEWKLTTVLHEYSILTRPPADTGSVMASLARPWNVAKRILPGSDVLARFRVGDFHTALARAAATAIDQGAPLLRDQFTTSTAVNTVAVAEDTQTATDRFRLQAAIDGAEARAVTASEETLRLQQRRARLEADAGIGPDGPLHRENLDLVQARLDHYEKREDQAWQARQRAIDDLAAYETSVDAAPVLRHVPTIDDMRVALDTLVMIATTEDAELRVARSLQALISNLEFTTRGAFDLDFTFSMDVPGPSGGPSVTIHDITGTVPTFGREPVGYESWGQAYAEELCLRRLEVDHSYTSRLGTTRTNASEIITPRIQARRLAARYLTGSLGMSGMESDALLASPVLIVRTIVWNQVNRLPNLPSTLGVAPEFVAAVIDAYCNNVPSVSASPSTTMRERQAILGAVIEVGSLTTTDILPMSSLDSTAGPKARAMIVRNSLRVLPDRMDAFLRIELTPVPGVHPPKRVNHWFPIPCPHCIPTDHPETQHVHTDTAQASPSILGTPDDTAWLDIIAWEPEVPGGLLCSTCMRSPRDPRTVYPGLYRTLHARG